MGISSSRLPAGSDQTGRRCKQYLCPFCGGTGQRRNLEWQALQALREMRRALRTHGGDKYVFETTRELGLYLLNHKRDSLRDMEQDFGKCLEISIRP